MKRVQKNILGLSGLGVVAAMTAFAVAIPGPEALAITTSVVDTINVKVVEHMPSISVSSTLPSEVVTPTFPYTLSYSHADRLIVTLTYHVDGEDKTIEIEKITGLGDEFGDREFSLNVSDLTFPDEISGSFGEYTITATVVSLDGTPVNNYLTFAYLPVTGEIRDNVDGTSYIGVTGVNEQVAKVEVKTAKGVVVGSATISQLTANNIKIQLNLDEVGCQEKLYLYSYADGEVTPMFEPYLMTTECLTPPDTGAPDTGGLFQNLNISREDYLITGLIVFFVLGIVGIGVVAKNRKPATKKKRR